MGLIDINDHWVFKGKEVGKYIFSVLLFLVLWLDPVCLSVLSFVIFQKVRFPEFEFTVEETSRHETIGVCK